MDTYEAFCGIVHEAELEALLVSERLGESFAQGVGRKSGRVTELELREDHLQRLHNATIMACTVSYLLRSEEGKCQFGFVALCTCSVRINLIESTHSTEPTI
jgi:hypothetical protein